MSINTNWLFVFRNKTAGAIQFPVAVEDEVEGLSGNRLGVLSNPVCSPMQKEKLPDSHQAIFVQGVDPDPGRRIVHIADPQLPGQSVKLSIFGKGRELVDPTSSVIQLPLIL